MDQLEMKKLAARAALKYVKPDTIVGVGSGSTVNCFIEALGELKDQIQGAVAASKASEELLRKQGIEAVFPIQIDTLAMVCQPEREAAAFFFADSCQSLIQIEILQHNIAVVDTFKMPPFEAKGKRDAVVFQQYHIFADMLLITRKAIFLTALPL